MDCAGEEARGGKGDLGCISAISRRYLGDISAISRQGRRPAEEKATSAVSRRYLGHISATSRLDARVALEEDLALAAQQELDRSRRAVAARAADLERVGEEPLPRRLVTFNL